MSLSLRPATCNDKSQLMELGSTRTLGSNNMSVTPIPLSLLQSDMLQSPAPAQDPKLALFKHLVMTIEKSNAMKRRLNSYWKRRRINPDNIEMVLEDKLEDQMPNISEFLDLPPPPGPTASGLQHPAPVHMASGP